MILSAVDITFSATPFLVQYVLTPGDKSPKQIEHDMLLQYMFLM